jgi:Protein of unknown function (DUF1360)
VHGRPVTTERPCTGTRVRLYWHGAHVQSIPKVPAYCLLRAPIVTDFIIAALATWRLSFMLTHEDGPWEAFARLRAAAGRSMPGRALDCLFCTSVWVAAPLALLLEQGAVRRLVTWMALSGAAGLLHRATDRGLDVMPLPPRELPSNDGA